MLRRTVPVEIAYGHPVWTSGVFGTPRAQDDLGVEEVGAGLLRRLLPGVVQNTPHAGYYSFYPYLLHKWEELGGDVAQAEFKPFYRRHESAFALACALHDHRDGVRLTGVNGSDKTKRLARDLLATGATHVDVERVSEDYMDEPLGGYGLFYARALEHARLVRPGERRIVDRVTDFGREVAGAFAETFEATAYCRRHLEPNGPIPLTALHELGDAVCLCTIPGRSDHELLLDTFFGEPLENPGWEEARLRRIASLALFLEFHAQRPDGAEGDLAAWRRALVERRFSDGTRWTTAHPEMQASWRAYQCRELGVHALTTIWSLYLAELAARGEATHAALRGKLRGWLTAERLGVDPGLALGDAAAALGELIGGAYELARHAEPLEGQWTEEPERALCRAISILVVLPREIAREEPGFTELLDEGSSHRWSLRHLASWLAARSADPLDQVVAELVDALHHQHVRIALLKVRVPTARNLASHRHPWRDPFCFADDDGVLRPLRLDEPFWTGARYDVVNHLLWTLGLLTDPDGTALTALGTTYLERHGHDA
jgi:hypothetical protein